MIFITVYMFFILCWSAWPSLVSLTFASQLDLVHRAVARVVRHLVGTWEIWVYNRQKSAKNPNISRGECPLPTRTLYSGVNLLRRAKKSERKHCFAHFMHSCTQAFGCEIFGQRACTSEMCGGGLWTMRGGLRSNSTRAPKSVATPRTAKIRE